MLEQPAKLRLATDLVETDERRCIFFIVLRANQPVANRLMRPAFVVVVDVLAQNGIKLRQLKDNKMIERLMLQALYPPLHKGVHAIRHSHETRVK